MILPVPHIAQLCETWWERMADEPRAWQGRYADELLRLLGWETPLPFSPREASTSLGARPFILRANGKNTCIVYFVQPGTIDPPSAVVERGLDFCPATRMLAEEAHEIGVSRALITDLYRFYLYDSTKGELLRAWRTIRGASATTWCRCSRVNGPSPARCRSCAAPRARLPADSSARGASAGHG
jgi:hypothetical protein